ncbi:MAG: hypothetical protein ABIH34_03215 [Nanoarchaeota archaeon]
MNELKTTIDAMEYHELLALKKELQSGALNLKKVISKKIIEHKKQHSSRCATCQAPLDPQSSHYTLLIGPEDFMKKASFCAADCLTYFLQQIQMNHDRD